VILPGPAVREMRVTVSPRALAAAERALPMKPLPSSAADDDVTLPAHDAAPRTDRMHSKPLPRIALDSHYITK